jgi:hypothetical protein
VAAYIGSVLVDVFMSHCLVVHDSRTARHTHNISSHIATHRCTVIDYFKRSVTSLSTDNELPEDGVTAPKHVGAVLMSILILFFKDNRLCIRW